VKALPPARPTYGPGPKLIKLIRFLHYMKVLRETNEQYFQRSRDEEYETLSPLQKGNTDGR
jgi:hypothetical protein